MSADIIFFLNQSSYEAWGKCLIPSLGSGENLGDVGRKRVKTGVLLCPVIIRI